MVTERKKGPAGFCQCGCGGKTRISAKTDSRCGDVKGEPRRFLKGHHIRVRPIQSALEPPYRVDENGCWLWMGFVDAGGYGDRGTRRVDGARKAHRWYFELHRGLVPDSMQVHHVCKVPRCVNPDHLELVTASQHRKLHPKRRGKYASKLDPERVKEIRSRVAAGESQSAVARSFGVVHSAVNKIVHGRTWADVP